MLQQFCIMLVSCPSLRCSCRKKTSLMRRSKGFGHGVVVSKNCCNILIAPLWMLQRKLLASVGWNGAAGLSAAHGRKMMENVTHCRKEICSTCLFKESMPAQFPVVFFLQRHSTYQEIRESVRVNYWVGSHNPARTSPGSMFDLWISDRFEWFFVVDFLYPNLLSSLDPSNSYSCLSQWSFQ